MRALIFAIGVVSLGFAVLLIVKENRETSSHETVFDKETLVRNVEKAPMADANTEEVVESALMDFDDTLLSEAIQEFNKRNATQIELSDPSIGELRITAALRTDNPDAFVNLLELVFELRIEEVGASTIRLHRKDRH